jgi:predicted transglutaminase-like cysteine proteinase
MRTISKWLIAITATIVIGGNQVTDAGFVGMPQALGSMMRRISFSNYTLPPMAYTQFCLRYADQCKPQRMVFRGGPVHLTEERWEDLKAVNKRVNAAIIPERNTEGLAGEKWLINPASGDCNDYAVSKRSDLLARGWPEHHLVLVVRTSMGDFVLDNMTPQIRPWAPAPYH